MYSQNAERTKPYHTGRKTETTTSYIFLQGGRGADTSNASAPDFITRNEGKRQIKPKKFDNCISTNIVTRQSRINSKSVKVPEAKSEQYNNSFSVRMAIDWNNLEDNIVQSKTTEDFKTSIFSCHRSLYLLY